LYHIVIFTQQAEYCGVGAYKHGPALLSTCNAFLLESNPDLWQAAVYGYGVLAEHGGPSIDQYSEATLRMLLGKAEQWRNDDTGNASAAADNAISAAVKFCLHRSQTLSPVIVKGALPVLLSWLPLETDIAEGRDTLRRIVTHVEQNSASLLTTPECKEPLTDLLLAVMAYQLPEQDEEDDHDHDNHRDTHSHSDNCGCGSTSGVYANADDMWESQFTDAHLRRRVEALLSSMQTTHPAVLAAAWQRADENTRIGVQTATDTFEKKLQ
jgi:hypothetical protein